MTRKQELRVSRVALRRSRGLASWSRQLPRSTYLTCQQELRTTGDSPTYNQWIAKILAEPVVRLINYEGFVRRVFQYLAIY